MFLDNIKVTGSLTIDHYDQHMRLKECRKINNLVVSAGKNLVMTRLAGNTKGPVTHIGLGTGNLSPSLSDTDLQVLLSTRQTIDSATVNNNVITYIKQFNPGVCTGALTEAGLFNAVTDGDMLSRVLFNVINKDSLDTIVITWAIVLS